MTSKSHLTSSSSSSVKLDTFSYTPLDPTSESDLEQGKQEHRVGDETTEEDDDGGVEEELIWNQHSEQQRGRKRGTWWIRQVALFSVGALVGAGLLSLGNWAFNGKDDRISQSSSSSSSRASPNPESDFDFATNPPVRIHYREEPNLNSRAPLLSASKCPAPVLYETNQDSADIVVFNSDSAKGLGEDEMREWRNQKPWQKLVIWGVESAPNRDNLEKHFDKLREGKRNETYDYEMTCKLTPLG